MALGEADSTDLQNTEIPEAIQPPKDIVSASATLATVQEVNSTETTPQLRGFE